MNDEVPSIAVIFATGNNLTFDGDMTRSEQRLPQGWSTPSCEPLTAIRSLWSRLSATNTLRLD